MLSEKKIQDIVDQITLATDLSNSDLLEFCILANESYRSGSPLITDENYDFIYISELQKDYLTILFSKKLNLKVKGFLMRKLSFQKKCSQLTKHILGER